MTTNKLYIIIMVLIALLIAIGYYSCHQSQKISLKDSQVKALADTTTLYKTKSGASGAEKTIFQGSKSDVLTVLKKQDSTGYKSVKNTADVHSYSTVSTKVKIDTTVKADSAIEIIQPKGFYKADINVKNDSVGLKVELNDKYHIVTHEKSNGLFKGKSYVVTVENENPYVTITDTKSFEITPEKKHLGLKIGGVIAVGVGVFLLVHK